MRFAILLSYRDCTPKRTNEKLGSSRNTPEYATRPAVWLVTCLHNFIPRGLGLFITPSISLGSDKVGLDTRLLFGYITHSLRYVSLGPVPPLRILK